MHVRVHDRTHTHSSCTHLLNGLRLKNSFSAFLRTTKSLFLYVLLWTMPTAHRFWPQSKRFITRGEAYES